MNSIKNCIEKYLKNDFIIAGILLILFLATNRYVYGWDDQHLEITTLKHLIDPALYAGDYYVEALSKHFSTFLFHLLARLITVDMIPGTYLFLYCVVRFFLFFWSYKLWHHLSGSRSAAFAATAAIFLLLRPEDLIYRTFSHQEFTYAIIFAGFYAFYKNKILLAAFLYGIAANFHALYSLFPMMYLSAYAFFFIKDRFQTFFKTSGIFLLAALPFILWHLPNALTPKGVQPSPSEWIPLYLLSCPQCFPFDITPVKDVLANAGTFFKYMYPHFFLLALYTANCIFNPEFRKDQKAHALFGVSVLLVIANFYFAYVQPSRIMLDLNLMRTEMYALFLIGGYTVIGLVKTAQSKSLYTALSLSFILLLVGWAHDFNMLKRAMDLWWIAALIVPFFAAAFLLKNSPHGETLKKMLIFIPLLGMSVHFCILHYKFAQITTHPSGGFWQLQQQWEDMQFFVKKSAPKDAMILTPYDMEMGGFRIHSERKVVVCYRDCGMIGFDYSATREWQERIHDMEPFKVFSKENILQAVVTAIVKYKATHIVFMNYYAPKEDVPFLKKMYENQIFSLYQVHKQ